jgi:hypothetical protein
MLVTNVSNTCSAKTYCINRLTHKNCKRVTTSNPTAQLTNELVFCSHVILAPIAEVVNYIFLSPNILSISLYITEWKLKNPNKSTVLTSAESINRTMKKKSWENNLKDMGTKCTQFHKSRKLFCSAIKGLSVVVQSDHHETQIRSTRGNLKQSHGSDLQGNSLQKERPEQVNVDTLPSASLPLNPCL